MKHFNLLDYFAPSSFPSLCLFWALLKITCGTWQEFHLNLDSVTRECYLIWPGCYGGTITQTPTSTGVMNQVCLYLSGSMACLNAMLPEASQTTGVRWAACIPVRCSSTVYDPLKQQRTKMLATLRSVERGRTCLATCLMGTLCLFMHAWPRWSGGFPIS